LCERCARERHLLPEKPGQAIDLKALVNLMMAPSVTPLAQSSPASATMSCPRCGLTYAAFKGEGRFGCTHDYEVFRTVLEPLFERVHRATSHAGKIPSRARAAQIDGLRDRLKAAVASENYEQAARLRDLIRQMEAEGIVG
ncbi:MAG: UvrB/UvrC motif-containing protein, partial [Gemmataceae bacterium]